MRRSLLTLVLCLVACNGDSAPVVNPEAGALDRGAGDRALSGEAVPPTEASITDAPPPDAPARMCTTSADCKEASVSFPGETAAPTPTPTACVAGRCGLVTAYSGPYASPKTPRACTELCAASTYAGQAMKCAASCRKRVINGYGDLSLVFDEGGDAGGGPGSLAGLVRYQFSPMSGGYKFVEVTCSTVPQSKLVQGSNSYKYVTHQCCCVAP